jgi:MFS family permease
MWLRIYLYELFQSLIVDNFLWFIYLLHLGYSATLIGLGYAAYSATMLAFNVPSSWIADRFSKRAVLFTASIAKTLGSICFLFGGLGFGLIVAGFVMAGIATALPSGVDLAYVQNIVNDGPENCGSSGVLRAKLSRFVSMQGVASLAAGVLGGALAAWSWHVLYLADTIVGIITMVLVWSLPAPRKSQDSCIQRQAGGFLWKPYCEAARLLIRGPVAFRAVAGVIAVVWALAAVQTTYTQGLLRVEGLSVTVIPLVFAATAVLAVAGSWCTGRLKTRSSKQAGAIALTWLYAVSGALRAVSLPSPAGAVISTAGGIAGGQLASGLSGVLFNEELLRHTPQGSESVALSAVNTMQMLLMMAGFPLFGLLAARIGFHAIFAVCGIALAAVAVILTVKSLFA